ncbi:aspartate-semialdehyde dehydrogenase [Streptomyces sp. NPDC050504]|uniref:aspartate-semialdehyde dehydrogenase n=1 Tax=Streptomyces sp. NPDC050504 TaxID=3365618 RepID=UPI0037ABBBC4
MKPKPTLAVVGATGTVGSIVLQILSQHADVWGEIRLLASARTAGRKLAVRGAETEVLELGEEALEGVDVALFTVPAEVCARWAPVAVAKGAAVVDGSGAFGAEPDVPLVVPELNSHGVRLRPRGIVACPSPVTLSLIVAVGALHAEFGLRELVVSTYQAASGAGPEAVAALRAQLAEAATGGKELGSAPGDVRRVLGETTGPLAAPLALNVVPWTGATPGSPDDRSADGWSSDGWSSDELRIRGEVRKVLDLPTARITATCAYVPVITTHSASVHARFENEVAVERAHEILATSPGVVLFDDPAAGDFPTPADVVGTDPTWVGRVRRSPDDPRALDLFVCGDNLRKGAALNAAQIAEVIAAEAL